MKEFLIKFKSIIQFSVSIIASREFAFIYCVLGTIAQTAHTYYLLDGISSLTGIWKIIQSLLLSFFISSSLLYFTAISDNNDKTPSGKRVLNAVMLFMWLEIVINLYYYSKHIIIDTNNYDLNNLFQLAFGVLIAVIIPVTIKLYSSQIRAKEWLDLDFVNPNKTENNQQFELEITNLKNEMNFVTDKLEKLNTMPIEMENPLGTNPSEYVSNLVNESLSQQIDKIESKIESSFKKNSELSLKQFQNKLEIMMKK